VPRGEGTAAGCSLQPTQFHACALEKARQFNPPRTPDGQPNMQGKDSSYELLEEACHEGNQYTLIGQGRIGLKRYQGVTPPR
jgi:hypothetical protein